MVAILLLAAKWTVFFLCLGSIDTRRFFCSFCSFLKHRQTPNTFLLAFAWSSFVILVLWYTFVQRIPCRISRFGKILVGLIPTMVLLLLLPIDRSSLVVLGLLCNSANPFSNMDLMALSSFNALGAVFSFLAAFEFSLQLCQYSGSSCSGNRYCTHGSE